MSAHGLNESSCSTAAQHRGHSEASHTNYGAQLESAGSTVMMCSLVVKHNQKSETEEDCEVNLKKQANHHDVQRAAIRERHIHIHALHVDVGLTIGKLKSMS